MKSISLYEYKNSFLNNVTPGAKTCYIVTALLVPMILGSVQVHLIFILISISLLISAKVFRKTFPMLFLSLFLMITISIIQGVFRRENITPMITIGGVTFYKEGLWFALKIILNLWNIIFSACVLILTTKPSDAVNGLVRRGMSPRIGYVIVSLFLLIPQMTERMATITDAQRSRGMETDGNVLVRIKAFFPLLAPVIMSSLMDIKERSLALEVRGFNAKTKKSFLNEFEMKHWNKWIYILLISVIFGAIVWRLFRWLI
ncbi:MAG: energy-coupling factor transporter transmembrane component T [Eubacteriales bacterium]